MKRALRITGIVFMGILLLGLISAGVVRVPYFQQKITLRVTGYLEGKIGSKVSVGYTKFTPFHHLVLSDVYLEDQRGDTLLYAGEISAGFDFLPLLQGELRFSSAHLSDFDVQLRKESADSPLNIQYIIDAFRSEPDEESTIDLIIDDIKLEKGRFSYTVVADDTRKPLKFENIFAHIQMPRVQGATVEAAVKSLSFNEISGFQVKKSACDFLYDNGNITIKQLNVKLPHSEFYLRDIAVQYDPQAADPLQFRAQLASSPVRLRDISRWVPLFSRFDDQLEIAGHASGSFKNLELTNLSVREGKDVNILTNLTIRGLDNPDPEKIHVKGTIRQALISTEGMKRMVSNFSTQPQPLPEVLQRLGTIEIEGKANGYLKNLTALFNLSSEVGKLRADVNFQTHRDAQNALTGIVEGKITGSRLNIRRLTNNADFGSAQVEMRGSCLIESTKKFSGKIDATIKQCDYKAYNYQNVNLSGDFTQASFTGSVRANGPDGRLAANGAFLFKEANSQFNFTAEVSNLQLHRLHLVPDNYEYTLRHLSMEASRNNDEQRLTFVSDEAEGEITGHYTFKTLFEALQQTISAYLPSVATPPLEQSLADFKANFTLNNTERLSSVLNLPVTIYEKARIDAIYNGEQNKILLNGDFPEVEVAGFLVENGKVYLNNDEECISLKINGETQLKKNGKLNFEAKLRAMDDLIYSDVQWLNDDTSKYKGELDFTTRLAYVEKSKQFSLQSTFQQSELVFNNSVWVLSPAAIAYQNERWSIRNFRAKESDQLIEIEGNVSQMPTDEITLTLNKVDLDYVFKSLDIPALTFGGIATGSLTAKDLYTTRELSTYLDVRDFAFNDAVFGNMALRGRWDNDEQGVEMKGRVIKNDSSFVNVDGFIYPVKEQIAIDFDTHRTSAVFLRKYLNTVTPNFSGELTGTVRLLGNLNDPTVEGTPWIENASFDIDFLNTTYTFSDWVRCKPDEIALQNVILHDKHGRQAIFSGWLHHNVFEDVRFSAQISCDNFLVFDATPKKSPTYYGSIFGSGTATIQGTEDLVRIDAAINPTEGTQLTFNFLREAEVKEYNFINFVDRQADAIGAQRRANAPTNSLSRTDLRFNLTTNVTDVAKFDVLMDATSKDKISGSGTGNLQLQAGTQTPVKIFGTYQIEQGNYNFSFLQAFFRNFKIAEGGSVTFRGDPMAADLNLKAAYTVSANIGDLDQNLLTGSSSDMKLSVRDNVPVSCVLQLDGRLNHPTVKFDLELPGATAELERQVKSYIRTEDMLQRQIGYLLTLGRFYTAPEYTREDSPLNNNYTLLTDGLSTQVNNLIEQVLPRNVRVGVKLHQYYEGYDANTEAEVMLSGTLLNNRLLFNTNFGYVNTTYAAREMPLVGDVDVEYKLTKTGNTRLKVFNHYNYRNYFSLTPEWTQGVGILFRRDFNTPKEMFQNR